MTTFITTWVRDEQVKNSKNHTIIKIYKHEL
jgi:hypothetical protein